jgi:DMSO reductase family type II enzyme heme b subunit
VVLERELGASAAFDARFQPGEKMQIAFTVWDGARGEKGSRKSISEWVELHLDAPSGQVASQDTEPHQP